jgi:hypothetical protein
MIMYFSKEAEKESRQDDREEQGLVIATLIQGYAAERMAARGKPDRNFAWR